MLNFYNKSDMKLTRIIPILMVSAAVLLLYGCQNSSCKACPHRQSCQNRADYAKNIFRGEQGYNCAQAVLAAYKDIYDVQDRDIDEFAAYGGGRVQDNMCGALYAALWLLGEDKEAKEQYYQRFEEKFAYISCKELLEKSDIPCEQIVAFSVELFEDIRE